MAMRIAPAARWLFGLWLGMAVACGRGPAASELPARSGAPVLSVQAGPAKERHEGPVRVTYFGPKGDTAGQVEITVAFDRPMVAMGTSVAADDALTIEPRIAGRARWVGSQTLLFDPADRLPMATSYRVRVPAGLTALDGTSLPAPLDFGFTTPAVEVARVEPNGYGRELRERAFELYFNQPVSVAELEAHARVEVTTPDGQTRAASMVVARPEAGDAKHLRISPKQPYPKGAHVQLRIDTLRGEEGPRALAQPFEASFDVFGKFELTTRNPCQEQPKGKCAPEGGLSLTFTNPVKRNAVLRALRFSPALPAPLDTEGDDFETEYVYVPRELAPETSYQVRLEGPLVDVFGNAYEGPRELTVRTRGYEPWAYFPIDGDLMQAGTRASLALRVRNVPQVNVQLSRLAADEIEPLASTRLDKPRKKAEHRTLEGAGPREKKTLDVDLSSLLEQGKGVVLARVVRRVGRNEETLARTLLAFTDLGPSLKVSPRGGLVWLTRLSSARAVEGADVRIVDCGKDVARGRTDGAGMFRFSLKAPGTCELYAVVEKDGDVSFAHQYGGVGPWELTQHSDYEGQGPVEAFVFTERGIYRSGETMRIKGVLRTRGERAITPTSGKVSLRIADAQDQVIETSEAQLSDYGTFSYTLRIPGSVALGPLAIQVSHGERSFSESVQVAEFRRAEIEADVSTERDAHVRGEKASLHVRAQYLFGAPLSDARVLWSARRMERDIRPEGERYEGFTFDDQTRWFEDVVPPEDTTLAGGEAKLDGKGELVQSVPLELPIQAGAAAVELEATVEGLGGISTSSRTLISVTPAAYLVGVRPQKQLVAANEALPLELVAAKLGGEAVAGAALDVRFERRSYETRLETGEGGAKEYKWTHRDELVGTCAVKSADKPVRCEVTPKAPGLYFVRVASKDKRGRAVSAALPVYVYGEGMASWGESEGPVITLKSDRAKYKLGDTAKVLVASPFDEAEALITVEREGVISVERRHVKGRAATLDIAVDERFVPNAFVSVLLVRPRVEAHGEDDGRPAFRVGSVELTTDVSQRHLRVAVTPDAAEKRPGDTLKVKLDVHDGAGKPTQAELTVFAVDEGVLSVTGYQTPDPFARIYAPRGLAVWTADARGRLAREGAGEDDKGGSEGGGGGAMVLRRDFEAVAFYAPEVHTDASGHAEVEFRLPDSLTRYRVMAVAVSRGAELGSGDAAVRTKKPLMLRPMLPRVVRAGDALSAGAVVHNETQADLEVELELDVSGLALEGSPKRKLRVPKGRGVEVRYPLVARSVGTAKLAFRAQAGKEGDGFEVTREVRAPTVLETVSTTGSTQAEAVEALGALERVRPDVGGLRVRLSTSALSGLEAPARALAEYPYACTEQLASRLVGLAALARLDRRGVLSASDAAKQGEAVLSELERHQREDGSFGLWSATEPSTWPPLDAFLTGYALVAMKRAEQASIPVSEHSRTLAKTWLASYLRGERDALSKKLGGADLAFVVSALAESGAFDASYAGKLFETRATLPLLAKIELARAYVHDPKPAHQVRVLGDEILQQLRVTADEAHVEQNLGDAYDVVMVSSVRATSELVLLWLETERSHPMLPHAVRWLSNARELDGTWGSTQENAWGLTALASYVDVSEPRTPALTATASLDDRSLGRFALEGRKASAEPSVPMADLPKRGARLRVATKGEGTLHYTARLTYAKSELPSVPEERGFYVERSYERIDPASLARGEVEGEPSEQARVGDYVRVTLRIAVPDTRRFVLIEDPLPVGIEPLSFSLVTESQAAAQALGLDQGPSDHTQTFDDRVVFAVNQLEPGLYRYTYLARATTAGRYVVPPARVSEMYHPETFGSSPARSFEVVVP